jgi:uncharacterized protein
MNTVLTAIGLVLVIEGLLYAMAPGSIKRMMAMMQQVPDEQLRMVGLGVATVGVILAWAVRLIFS